MPTAPEYPSAAHLPEAEKPETSTIPKAFTATVIPDDAARAGLLSVTVFNTVCQSVEEEETFRVPKRITSPSESVTDSLTVLGSVDEVYATPSNREVKVLPLSETTNLRSSVLCPERYAVKNFP